MRQLSVSMKKLTFQYSHDPECKCILARGVFSDCMTVARACMNSRSDLKWRRSGDANIWFGYDVSDRWQIMMSIIDD